MNLAVETMNLAVETMNLRLNMSETENDESIPLTGRSSLRSGGRSVTKCDTLTQTHAHTHTHTHTHTPLVRTHICTRTYACRMWKEFGEYQDVLPSIAGVPNACVCSRPGSSRSARVSLSEKAFRGRQEGAINLFPNPMFENSNASFVFTGEYYLCKLNRKKIEYVFLYTLMIITSCSSSCTKQVGVYKSKHPYILTTQTCHTHTYVDPSEVR